MRFEGEEYTSADKQAYYEAVTGALPGRVCQLQPSECWVFRHVTCARECQLTDQAERLFPVLYEQVIAADGVREIEGRFPGSF